MIPHTRQRTRHASATFTVLLLLLWVSPLAHTQPSVTTYHNDNGRTGQNLAEPYLSLSNVNPVTFGKLFSMPTDGYIYAQPLYLPGANIPNKGTHNVVYVATQHDSVYAFDADNSAGPNSVPLWQLSFINPANGVTTVDINALLTCNDIIPEVGITGTPVIDPSTNTLYVVAKTQENGAVVQRLHALDVATGAEKFGGPVIIQGQAAGTGAGSAGGILTFDPLKQNQRAGLLLQNGLVYIAWASHCDRGPWHGWVMAYDAITLGQIAVWVSTPNGSSGGIWQGGNALAADSNYVYFATGNGTFNADKGGSEFGDSILKVSPPAGGTLSEVDYFAPHDQDAMRRQNNDLGAGGVMLIPDQFPGVHQNLLVAGGKTGTFYVVDRDYMGEYDPFFDHDVQTMSGVTGPIWNSAAWWNDHLYMGSNAKPLQAFTFDPVTETFNPAAGSQSANLFTARAPTPSISVNGSDAIVWALDNGAYSVFKPTVLYAYDASNLANMLYNSKQNASRDALGPAVKFTVPTVVNGKVYTGTANQLDVLGLLPRLTSPAGANQIAAAGSMLAVPLQVIATDPYSGTAVSGATVTFSDGGKHGTFSNPVAVTDAAGLASTTYKLPTKAQNLTITASAPGYTLAAFTETGIPGPAARVSVVNGNKQGGLPSTALPLPLVVKVKDQYNNAVSGASVTFSDGGAGGSYSASPVTTDSSGLASVVYTTPAATGTVSVRASVTGAKTATFTVTVQ